MPFACAKGAPPFSAEFLSRARDEAFLIYRTHADPRCLDPSLDPNDRQSGSVWGNGTAGARAVNYPASQMGRITSMTGFLSQWSTRSRADGPRAVADEMEAWMLAL